MGTATVLVVDDERKIRDTVRAFLEHQRYAVLVAGTGQEALDVAGRRGPAIRGVAGDVPRSDRTADRNSPGRRLPAPTAPVTDGAVHCGTRLQTVL
jgi:CheY-like chemotaxis protein